MSWEYLDSYGERQGPFQESLMKQWYENKFFPLDIRVRLVGDKEYAAIKDLKPPFALDLQVSDEKSSEAQPTVVEKTKEGTEPEEKKATSSSEYDSKSAVMPDMNCDDEKKSVTEDRPPEPNENIVKKTEIKESEETAEKKATVTETIEGATVPALNSFKKDSGKIANDEAMGPVPTSNEVHWLYLDNGDKIQGPFANSMMYAWFSAGHFDGAIRVKKYVRPDAGQKLHHPENLLVSSFCTIDNYKDCDFKKPPGADKSKLKWFYLDDKGSPQGPYSSASMLRWIHRGLMLPIVKVRWNNKDEFTAIKDLDNPFGDDFNPEPKPWMYMDDEGKECGPFLLSIMTVWFKKGLLDDEVKCKQLLDDSWSTVKKMKSFFTKRQEDAMEDIITIQPETGDDTKWFYLDLDAGKEQGPFTTESMQSWFDAGFLPPFTKVRTSSESDFADPRQGHVFVRPGRDTPVGHSAAVTSCCPTSTTRLGPRTAERRASSSYCCERARMGLYWR
eukprot:634829_1